MTTENDNGKCRDQHSLATERQCTVIVIEDLCQQFMRCFNACPTFCTGHLQDALEEAFHFYSIKKCRPLLIYIHHDNNILDVFSSDILNEFLDHNYIVWPWNITDENNRNTLIKIWTEQFPQHSPIHFSMDQCPMLICITQGVLSSEYELNILLEQGVLIQTEEQLSLEPLLYQLIDYREEFIQKKNFLSSYFREKTGFPWELVLKIAVYLSLNDTIATFSSLVLLFLSNGKMKLHITRPSRKFLEIIMPKIKYKQINSLSLDASQYKQTMELAPPGAFKHIKSFPLHDLEKILQIFHIKIYFPELIRLRVCYDKQVDFHCLCKIFDLVPDSTQRFEVHCGSIPCSHYRPDFVFVRIQRLNTTIKFVEFNVGHISSSLVNRCTQNYPKCVLRTIADVIKIMSKIENIQILVHRGNVEPFLDVNIWGVLVNECAQLKRITFKVLKKILEDQQLLQKIQQIEDELQNTRQTIKFEVKSI